MHCLGIMEGFKLLGYIKVNDEIRNKIHTLKLNVMDNIKQQINESYN